MNIVLSAGGWWLDGSGYGGKKKTIRRYKVLLNFNNEQKHIVLLFCVTVAALP